MFINKKPYHLQMKLLCIFTLSFCLGGCISRLARPEIIGTVIDESGQPIADVQVGENQTNSKGIFKLEERRYYAFLFRELLIMEAPMVYFQEGVSKFGFQKCTLTYRNIHGGGLAKGTQWQVGKVILKHNLNSQNVAEITECMTKTQEN